MSDWNTLQIALGRVQVMADELRGLADQCTSGGGRDAIMDIVYGLEDGQLELGDQLIEESSASD